MLFATAQWGHIWRPHGAVAAAAFAAMATAAAATAAVAAAAVDGMAAPVVVLPLHKKAGVR